MAAPPAADKVAEWWKCRVYGAIRVAQLRGTEETKMRAVACLRVCKGNVSTPIGRHTHRRGERCYRGAYPPTIVELVLQSTTSSFAYGVTWPRLVRELAVRSDCDLTVVPQLVTKCTFPKCVPMSCLLKYFRPQLVSLLRASPGGLGYFNCVRLFNRGCEEADSTVLAVELGAVSADVLTLMARHVLSYPPVCYGAHGTAQEYFASEAAWRHRPERKGWLEAVARCALRRCRATPGCVYKPCAAELKPLQRALQTLLADRVRVSIAPDAGAHCDEEAAFHVRSEYALVVALFL